MAFFTESEKHFKQDVLSYNTCKDIYRTSVMGKRVVEALVNFALSAEREISIQKAPPEAVERFNITAKQMKQKEAIKRTIYNARIYGTGALYVALHHIASDKDDFETKPNFNNVSDFEIFFNVLDPQNISGSVVDTNPLSSTFLQLIDIKVDNQIVPRKRIAVSHAVEPLYLDQRTSLIPYAPPSVFYNMIDLLKDYDASIEALDNLLYKAGAIIYKYPNQKFSGITLDAVKKSAEILEQKRNGAVISISEKCTVEDFPINNVNGLIESVNKLEDAITKALNDTPASLLFDKSLSNGFSEGDKDKETEISIIEAFRENKLTPLYTLTDYYVMLKAFDNDFINEMKDKYNDFKDKTNAQIFYEWVNSFKYEFGNLFPEPESATIENATKKLDNLLKLQQLGANTADIEAELNESGIFKQEIDLDGQQPDFDGDGIVGMDEPKKPDSEPPRASGGLSIDSDNPNNFRVDADIPAGHEWKTLDNGEHVLINSETGEIVAGANYESWIENYKKQKRREYFSDEPKWDDYGNEEDYKKAIHNHYFPQVEGTPDEIYKRLLDNINDAKSFKDMNFLMHGNKSGDFNRFIQEVNAIGKDRAKDIREKFDLKLAELRKASDKKSSQAGLDKPNKEPTTANKEPEPKPEPTKSKPKPTTANRQAGLQKVKINKIQMDRLNGKAREGTTYRAYADCIESLSVDPDDEDAKDSLKALDLHPIEIALMKFCNEGVKLTEDETKQLNNIISQQKISLLTSGAVRVVSGADPIVSQLSKTKIGDKVFLSSLSFSSVDIGNGAEFGSGGLMHTANDIRIKIEGQGKAINLATYSQYPEEAEIKVAGTYKIVDVLEDEPSYDIETGEPIDGTEKLTYIIKYVSDADAKVDNKTDTFCDNLIRFADLKTDAKKDFDESKIKRDKDGKFAKKSGNKDNSKDADNDKEEEFKARLKEARRIKRYLTNKMKTTTMSSVEKDRYKETLRRTEKEIEQIKEEREKYFNPEYHKDNKDDKDNDKQKDNNTKTGDNSGLDYGDLPTELHEPFKRLNTTTKPAELIFNNNNEYGLTIDDVKEISSSYSNPVDTTYCNINSFEINNDEGDTEEVDLTNRDNLQSPIEKFLYDFTCNSDNAKNEWGDQWDNEIKPQLKQMIKNAPFIKGKAYRVETFHANREEIVEGGKINFDCRSVSDNNKGYETVCNFSQPDYEYGEDIIIFEFPEDTRGLNIQGCSVYPNQYEYLVDGNFIMETVEKDEFDRTIVRLKKAE